MQNGILPFPGSMIDQPAFIIEILDMFQTIQNQVEEAERQKIEKKNKSSGRK
jgi:hypothetical protein